MNINYKLFNLLIICKNTNNNWRLKIKIFSNYGRIIKIYKIQLNNYKCLNKNVIIYVIVYVINNINNNKYNLYKLYHNIIKVLNLIYNLSYKNINFKLSN